MLKNTDESKGSPVFYVDYPVSVQTPWIMKD